MEQYKTCTRCKQSLSTSLFSFRKAAKDKLTSWCRPCMAENAKIIRKTNAFEIRAKAKVSYAQNREKLLQATRSWRANNKEKINEYQKQWRLENADKLKSYSFTQGSLRRSRSKGDNKFFISSKELDGLKRQPCAYCGAKDKIEIDHIVPLARGGEHRIGNLITSCQSCNRQKHKKTIMEWRLWKMRLGL